MSSRWPPNGATTRHRRMIRLLRYIDDKAQVDIDEMLAFLIVNEGLKRDTATAIIKDMHYAKLLIRHSGVYHVSNLGKALLKQIEKEQP